MILDERDEQDDEYFSIQIHRFSRDAPNSSHLFTVYSNDIKFESMKGSDKSHEENTQNIDVVPLENSLHILPDSKSKTSVVTSPLLSGCRIQTNRNPDDSLVLESQHRKKTTKELDE